VPAPPVGGQVGAILTPTQFRRSRSRRHSDGNLKQFAIYRKSYVPPISGRHHTAAKPWWEKSDTRGLSLMPCGSIGDGRGTRRRGFFECDRAVTSGPIRKSVAGGVNSALPPLDRVEDCMTVFEAIRGSDPRDPCAIDMPHQWAPGVPIDNLHGCSNSLFCHRIYFLTSGFELRIQGPHLDGLL
jgi:hypothetical protein